MSDTDLFGTPIKPKDLPATPGIKRKRNMEPRGYAAPPGSGPVGETCRSCVHIYRRQFAKTYIKCDLIKATGGPKTDIRAGSPACSRWEKRPPETCEDCRAEFDRDAPGTLVSGGIRKCRKCTKLWSENNKRETEKRLNEKSTLTKPPTRR